VTQTLPDRPELAAARLMLERMRISPDDLLEVAPTRPSAPTFAEYVPVVSAAVHPHPGHVHTATGSPDSHNRERRTPEQHNPTLLDTDRRQAPTTVCAATQDRRGTTRQEQQQMPSSRPRARPYNQPLTRPATFRSARSAAVADAGDAVLPGGARLRLRQHTADERGDPSAHQPVVSSSQPLVARTAYARGRCGHQGTAPASSKNPPVGPSSGSLASRIAMAAPCSGVRTPRKPLRSVAQ
jgi:hypothetical protein